MPDLKFEISAEDVRGFLQEALCKALAPAARDKLVTDAVHQLLKGSWQSPSELQAVFQRAVYDVAEEIAKTELSKPENQERIRQIVVEGWDKLMVGEKRDKTVENVSNAISRGLFGRDY